MAAARRIDVYFRKGGCIDINANVSRAIDLERGDVIDVHYDKETKELYLYVAKKADTLGENARYKAMARPTKPNSRNMRVQSKEITDFVRRLTGAEEAWLYVGTIKQTKIGPALPLIYLNNQYNKAL